MWRTASCPTCTDELTFFFDLSDGDGTMNFREINHDFFSFTTYSPASYTPTQSEEMELFCNSAIELHYETKVLNDNGNLVPLQTLGDWI